MDKRECYSPDIQCFYGYISHQVEREDGLINNRLNWFLTSSGLLFAAFAVAIGAVPNDWNKQILLFVVVAFPILGFVVSYYALQSVRAAERALNSLREAWEDRVEQYYGSKKDVAHVYFPRPYGDAVAWKGGHSFNKALPVCVGMTWLAALQAVSWFIFDEKMLGVGPGSSATHSVGILICVAGALNLYYIATRDFREPKTKKELASEPGGSPMLSDARD